MKRIIVDAVFRDLRMLIWKLSQMMRFLVKFRIW